MYPLGHVGLALLLVAPAVLLLDRKREYSAVAALALATSLLPDADTTLPLTHHHGGTHTLLFVVSASLAVGLALAFVSVNVSWLSRRIDSVPAFRPRSSFALGVGGSFVGLGSHLLADLLVIPVENNPVKPLWPLSEREVALGLIHPGDPAWNWGLLAAGIVAQALALSFARSRSRGTPSQSSG
jgi:membrane-bound metal-dependent hydrolase YbcI (DUF457 family)